MTEPNEMLCPYTGFGYCYKEKCFAYYIDQWTQKLHCKFVDQYVRPIYWVNE